MPPAGDASLSPRSLLDGLVQACAVRGRPPWLLGEELARSVEANLTRLLAEEAATAAADAEASGSASGSVCGSDSGGATGGSGSDSGGADATGDGGTANSDAGDAGGGVRGGVRGGGGSRAQRAEKRRRLRDALCPGAVTRTALAAAEQALIADFDDRSWFAREQLHAPQGELIPRHDLPGGRRHELHGGAHVTRDEERRGARWCFGHDTVAADGGGPGGAGPGGGGPGGGGCASCGGGGGGGTSRVLSPFVTVGCVVCTCAEPGVRGCAQCGRTERAELPLLKAGGDAGACGGLYEHILSLDPPAEAAADVD